MIKRNSFFILIFAIVVLSSCQKKMIIAEIDFEEKDCNSKYYDVKKINKRQLLSTYFIIQLKNNTNQHLEIIIPKDQPAFEGIGCHIDFKKTQGSLIKNTKLKLYPNKIDHYSLPLKLQAYKDDFTKDILENSSGNKFTIYPKVKYIIKLSLNRKELNEKKLRGLIYWSPDENYMKKEREITLTESKIPFDKLWEISVYPHILFAYRFANEPYKILLEHRTKIYSLEEGSDPTFISKEVIEEIETEIKSLKK